MRFRSPRDVFLAFDPDLGELDSGWRRQLRGSLERLHGAPAYVIRKSLPDHLGSRRVDLLDECNAWFKHPRSGQNQHTLDQLTLFPNWIQLSRELREMAAARSPVPIDFQTLAAQRRKPLAAKLYSYEAWRSCWPDVRARGAVRVCVFGPLGLAQQLGIQPGPGPSQRAARAPGSPRGDRDAVAREQVGARPEGRRHVPGEAGAGAPRGSGVPPRRAA